MARHVSPRVLLLLTLWLSACSPVSPSSILFPTRTTTQTVTNSPSPAATRTGNPSTTFTVTASPTGTPPGLPGPYLTGLLNPLDTPHPYLSDVCQYLQDKWSSTNSPPGTTVMVIMFHKITNTAPSSSDEISEFSFRQLMKQLYEAGFQAITTTQLADFMEHNAKIPEHSVLLVVDDRRTRDYFDRFFLEYRTAYGWPVVNAWISTPQSTADLWQQQVDLENAGFVDHQAHGVVHDILITSDSPDSYILGELQGSIDAFQAHFNKKPIAIIWPGGGFTPHAAALARQLGYRLGFTINPRGPLMFDWVPLDDAGDPARPTWIPEGPVGDPLLVLPRYWDTDAAQHLTDVLQISAGAAAYAEVNKSAEIDYYRSQCEPSHGPIP